MLLQCLFVRHGNQAFPARHTIISVTLGVILTEFDQPCGVQDGRAER